MRIKSILIIFLTMFVWGNLQSQPPDYYYYYQGKKVPLVINYKSITIVSDKPYKVGSDIIIFSQPYKVERSKQFFKIQDGNSPFGVPLFKDTYVANINTSAITSYKEYFDLLSELENKKEVIKANPSFLWEDRPLDVSNNIYIKLFNENDAGTLYAWAGKNSMQVLEQDEFMPLWFLLGCTKDTPNCPIKTANLFYESGVFEYASPELLMHNLLCSSINDPYFQYQWNLENTGQYSKYPYDCGNGKFDINALNAWTVTKGSRNIKVGIYDTGIEMSHPDLAQNIYGTGYDTYQDKEASEIHYGDDDLWEHATGVAGIVAAIQNNDECITGVAPNVMLISISCDLMSYTPYWMLKRGFIWAANNEVDVLNCSWGGYAYNEIIKDAIEYALTKGRKGIGLPIVFAAGNHRGPNPGILFPANCNPDNLVVGAIAPDGERKEKYSCDLNRDWNSSYGPELDVVAPGALIPTTRVLWGGCSSTFTGTSAAAAHVSGIAALLLSLNPCLSVLQVNNIIERTTQKVGSIPYNIVPDRPNGSWNQFMGYGLVDAYAAVNQACIETGYLVNLTVDTNTDYTSCGKIEVQNVDVINSAKLRLNSDKSVIINGPFEMELGSTLEINK